MEYNEDNFRNAKPFDLFEFTCENCGCTFTQNKRYIVKCGGKIPRYCSSKCRGEAKKTLIKVHCAECGKEKFVRKHEYETSKTGNFFCSELHAAMFNNKGRKHKNETKRLLSEKEFNILNKNVEYIENDTVCPICGNRKTSMSGVCKKCSDRANYEEYENKTLGEVLGENTTYTTKLCSTIRKHARRKMEEGSVEKVCAYCENHEYDEILEVHHIKGILTFNRETKIKEINDYKNLLWLCPNHHQMLEKGLISIEDIDLEKHQSVEESDGFSHKEVKDIIKSNIEKRISAGYSYKTPKKEQLTKEEVAFNQRRCEWPSKEELLGLIKTISFEAIGRRYGVTGNTVKKWCKRYGLPSRKCDIKEITE